MLEKSNIFTPWILFRLPMLHSCWVCRLSVSASWWLLVMFLVFVSVMRGLFLVMRCLLGVMSGTGAAGRLDRNVFGGPSLGEKWIS